MKSKRQLLRELVPASLILSLCLAPTAFAQESQRDQPQPPKIIRKSGGVLQGSVTRRVEPSYPPLAKAARISGSVVVEVTVDEEGNVIAARAISGHPLLKDAAVEAAKGWTFSPTQLQGVPVKVIGTITFNFMMDNSAEIEAVRKQLETSPNSAELHSKLAELLRGDKKHDEAIGEYIRALELGGDSADVLFGLAEALVAVKRLSDAIDAYKRASKVNSAPVVGGVISQRLGEVYWRQDRYDEALEAFKQAAAANPDSPGPHYSLGYTYLKLGDRQSAEREYRILKGMNEHTAELLRQALDKNK